MQKNCEPTCDRFTTNGAEFLNAAYNKKEDASSPEFGMQKLWQNGGLTLRYLPQEAVAKKKLNHMEPKGRSRICSISGSTELNLEIQLIRDSTDLDLRFFT